MNNESLAALFACAFCIGIGRVVAFWPVPLFQFGMWLLEPRLDPALDGAANRCLAIVCDVSTSYRCIMETAFDR